MPRKSTDPQISLDQAVKELLQIRPVDTLEFLLPEVVVARGRPQSWVLHNVQVRKKDLRRKGYVMDLNIEYSFEEGAPLLLVLVEHWSTARSMDLVRTAQYYLDLMSRFPGVEIVPVALITEIEDREVPDGFTSRALGAPVLSFQTRMVQLSRTSAERWAGVSNLVAQTFLMAMQGGVLPREVRLDGVIHYCLSCDEKVIELVFPLLIQVGRFTEEEHAMTYKYLTKLPKPLFMEWLERDAKASGMAAGLEEGLELGMAQGIEQGIERGIERGIEQGIERGLEQGIEQGIERGIRTKALEDARKLVEHGVSWAIITSATGIKPEDLESK